MLILAAIDRVRRCKIQSSIFGILALSFIILTSASIAAPPTTPANPFNARVETNAIVSPSSTPTIAQIKRGRHIQLVKSLQHLNVQNIQSVDTQVSNLSDQAQKLQDELDSLDKEDKHRDKLENELDDLNKQIEQLNAIGSIYQTNYDFLVTQLAQILARK